MRPSLYALPGASVLVAALALTGGAFGARETPWPPCWASPRPRSGSPMC
jgi:hypothetical protein